MKLEIKNLKVASYLSEETLAFDASLYVDGKRVGTVRNSGRGGNNDVDIRDKDGRWHRDCHENLEAFAATQAWTYEGETQSHNLDSYLSELVDAAYERQQLQRQLRGKILFRVSTEAYEDDVWSVIKAKYTPVLAAKLRAKYGHASGADVTILNEQTGV